MRVFLSGPMGSGKSTVGRRLAERLDLPFVDLDAWIEQRAGKSIAEIFASEGETAFRAMEREAALALCEDEDVVVALGGGTVANPEVRRALLDAGVVVSLDAPLEELLRRVGTGQGRPLLRAGAEARLRALRAERQAAYSEAHASVQAVGDVDAIAARIATLARQTRVVVPLGVRSYVVELGTGLLETVGARTEGSPRRVVVSDDNTSVYANTLKGEGVVRVTLPAGEEHKNIQAVECIWDAALDAGVDRGALVIAVGGGVVGDITGFAAATLMRGVRFAQVPTTVLAMVDSSVGGKTGVNRRAGKNLVGAFHQPEFVVCDMNVLETLDVRHRVSGLAEVVKAAWIDGEGAVAFLEEHAAALRAGDADAMIAAVAQSVKLKARVVADDERESGRRRVLNLGHTVGHGIEAAAGYGAMPHGEAVALGMVAACRVGKVPESEVRLCRLLEALGLPKALDEHLRSDVFEFVKRDKKRQGDDVVFIVPGAPGEIREELIPIAELESRVAR